MAMENKKKNWTRTKAYREVRDQMVADLQTVGIWSAYFADRIDRYMGLWCVAKELEADLSARGVRVEYQNGVQRGEADNKSLDRLLKVYSMMDDLHRQLGYTDAVKNSIKAATSAEWDDPEDEL